MGAATDTSEMLACIPGDVPGYAPVMTQSCWQARGRPGCADLNLVQPADAVDIPFVQGRDPACGAFAESGLAQATVYMKGVETVLQEMADVTHGTLLSPAWETHRILQGPCPFVDPLSPCPVAAKHLSSGAVR